MGKKEKWDGRSRPTTKLYKKNFDRIFGKKEKVEDPFGKSVKELLEEIDEDEMKEIEDRNGF